MRALLAAFAEAACSFAALNASALTPEDFARTYGAEPALLLGVRRPRRDWLPAFANVTLWTTGDPAAQAEFGLLVAKKATTFAAWARNASPPFVFHFCDADPGCVHRVGRLHFSIKRFSYCSA